MLFIVWIISTLLANYWTRKSATRSMDKGVIKYSVLWKKTAASVFIKVTLFYFIPSLMFAFGAGSRNEFQNTLAMGLIAWLIGLIPLAFVIPNGTRKIFREKSQAALTERIGR